MEKMENRFPLKTPRFIGLSLGELILIVSTIIIAAILRLYKISEYMTFLGDEGRDVMVAKGILEGDLTLLGPRASAGDFFLGPIYYYMIAPFLWLTRLDPVGPAIMVALIGVATVFLVYFAGKKFFGTKAGLIAAILYAISPLVIAYSRSSWNPNPMPFFSLLVLYILFVGLDKKKTLYFPIAGFLLGIALQLHYLTVFLGVITAVFIIAGSRIVERRFDLRVLAKRFLLMALGFITGLSPFLLFELRHNFPNLTTILQFVFSDTVSRQYATNHSFTTVVQDVFFRLFARLITMFPPPEQVSISEHPDLRIWQIATLLLALFSVGFLFAAKNKLAKTLLICWLSLGVLLFGFYKRPIYDYYFGFLFPLPFLLVGNFLSQVWEARKLKVWGAVLSLGILAILIGVNLTGAPFRSSPNRQKDNALEIANFVLSKTDDKPYNFALITDGNSDHVFRYFFEVADKAPVTIENFEKDPERKTVTGQLLIVCEARDCQPLGHPLWEIAGFGQAEIEGKWELPLVVVYKLIPQKP